MGASSGHQLPSHEKHFSPLEWNYMTIESLYFFYQGEGREGAGWGWGYSPQSPSSTIHVMMMMMMLMGLSRVQFGLIFKCVIT